MIERLGGRAKVFAAVLGLMLVLTTAQAGVSHAAGADGLDAFVTSTTASVLPVVNDGAWRFSFWLTNISGAQVSQKIGTKLEDQPNGERLLITRTVQLDPGETRFVPLVNRNFELGPKGNLVLPIEPGLRARGFYEFFSGGQRAAAFEMDALQRGLTAPGECQDFTDIRIDVANDTGAFPLVLNTGTDPATMTFRLFGPKLIAGRYPFADASYSAPPGVSLAPLNAGQLPDGGHMDACIGAPGLGGGGLVAPVYVAVVTGPTNGGTQTVRY